MNQISQKNKILLGAAAFILLLALAGFGYRALAKKASPQDAAASQTSKPAAPDFTVQDAGGNTVSFSQFKGKPIVLNFWASWCPPCKAEMPDYQKMYAQYAPEGVTFLMVNLTDGSRETVSTAKQFLKANRYTFPAYFDVKYKASDAYGISSIPDSIFVNRDGTIAAAYSGMLDAKAMKKNIEALIK